MFQYSYYSYKKKLGIYFVLVCVFNHALLYGPVSGRVEETKGSKEEELLKKIKERKDSRREKDKR